MRVERTANFSRCDALKETRLALIGEPAVIQSPPAAFSSGYVSKGIDDAIRKIELLLAIESLGLVERQATRINHAVRYLRANFHAAALTRGPVR